MTWKHITAVLGFICVFQAGLLLGEPLSPAAHADEPNNEPGQMGFYDPPRLYCRIFVVPLEGAGTTFETSDTTTEVGKWIEKEEQSYELFTMDLEIGQKPTGYPQGHLQVCLTPRKL